MEKALNCIGCGACVGSCQQGFLKIVDNCLSISVKCTHCLECLKPNGLRMGCVARNYGTEVSSIHVAN